VPDLLNPESPAPPPAIVGYLLYLDIAAVGVALGVANLAASTVLAHVVPMPPFNSCASCSHPYKLELEFKLENINPNGTQAIAVGEK
jgi:hypothetical protein